VRVVVAIITIVAGLLLQFTPLGLAGVAFCLVGALYIGMATGKAIVDRRRAQAKINAVRDAQKTAASHD
jgi:hypothetical protein